MKRLIYIEFMVFWKGNEEGKEKLEVKGSQGGLLPIFSYVSQLGPSCHDRVAQQRTQQARNARSSAHDTRVCMRATKCTRARDRDCLAPCRDRTLVS